MSYDTNYSLSMQPHQQDVMNDLLGMEDSWASYALHTDGRSKQPCDWYQHEADLATFSLKYPHILFILHGEGEEVGDLWFKYFKNGKIQVCKAVIAYPEFNESKMVEVTCN